MSDLSTIERAAEDMVALRKAARAKRKAFAASIFSPFERAMRKAMGLYRDARAQGVSREDAEKGLELEIRGCWPKSVSKFVPDCGSCDDTGWTEYTCWDQHRCGRKVCAANPERVHLYVQPCGCPNGDRMRAKIRTTDDAIAAAGRTTKRKARGFQQIGS